MADSIGDDIGPDGIIIPDRPQTALAFRTWRLSEANKLLSINAPSLTGKAGGSQNQEGRRVTWIHRQLADPEGQDGWPIGGPLVAHCGRDRSANAALSANPDHGSIPSKPCTCGIYATTSISVINQYLGNEIIQGHIAIRGSVLGVVELGGRVIPATQGFRAAGARVAAILLIDPVFSLSHSQLKQIAETYQVPALVPHSLDPEDYRDRLELQPRQLSLADEIDEDLKNLFEEGGDQ
jgi:hypothetical protein